MVRITSLTDLRVRCYDQIEKVLIVVSSRFKIGQLEEKHDKMFKNGETIAKKVKAWSKKRKNYEKMQKCQKMIKKTKKKCGKQS